MDIEHKVNEEISAPQVRVIGNVGEQLGVMPRGQALQLARDVALDLVEVAPGATPPVCRILDYGKVRYLQSKKQKEARKSSRGSMLREVRFRPHIGAHDLEAKLRKLRQLLAAGAKVRVTVRLRGRENAKPELGLGLLRRVVEDVKVDAKLERPPALEGRTVSVVLLPTKKTEKIEKKEAQVNHAQNENS